MHTKHTCPICKGKGTTTESISSAGGLAIVARVCDLCDGKGCLPSDLASVALRYKRKSDDMTTLIRHLRRIVDSHHSGKG